MKVLSARYPVGLFGFAIKNISVSSVSISIKASNRAAGEKSLCSSSRKYPISQPTARSTCS